MEHGDESLNDTSVADLAARLAACGLAAVAIEELAVFAAQGYALQAFIDGLHGHGIVLVATAAADGAIYAPHRVAPKVPLDGTDLPPPYRALRLAVYAAIAGLRKTRTE